MHRRQFLKTVGGGIAVAGLGMRAGAVPSTQPAAATRPAAGSRKAFSFLHTYESTGRYWRALEQAGLVRATTGIRLINSPWGTDDRRFNTVARVGGPLHQILNDRPRPFVIDRVVGGSQYNAYAFDQKLVAEYSKLLGDQFLGGQVHEVISNTGNDWGRLIAANPKFQTEPVRPDEGRAYFTAESAARHLEYGTIDDYAGETNPTTPAAQWAAYGRAARRQAARFGDRFSYCEGSQYGWAAWPFFYRQGAQSCFAEVGVWASSQSQFAIASLRGAARAAGKPWGIFYAPWGPDGCTSFLPPEDWSWQAPKSLFDNTGWPVNVNVGHSTALQRRMFFHAYLSGAHTIHEEWGAECNFENLTDKAPLSSSGQVTRDLLDFQDAHPDIGEPFTPLALVLDARYPAPTPSTWLATADAIRAVFFQSGPQDLACAARPGAGGGEAGCYAPCAMPEIFDWVPSDAPALAWDRYDTIIAVGNVPAPERAIRVSDAGEIDKLIQSANQLSPFERESTMPMQINRRASDGAWIVALYNPWGARRGDVYKSGSILEPTCHQFDTIRPLFNFQSARVLHFWPEQTALRIEGKLLHTLLGPGGTLILEII